MDQTAAQGGQGTIPVAVITGPVGVGKTSVASSISDLLGDAGRAHALIDMDWLRWCHPAPPHDPFHTALGIDNLARVWAGYRGAGTERLVLVDVVEERGMLDAYRAAIPGAAITLVRLHATLPTLHARLGGRERGANLQWHRERAAVLLPQMERDALEDLRVDTDGRDVEQIARSILRALGWE